MLGKFSMPGILLIWMIVGSGPTALAVGAGGDVGHFSTLFFLSLWETARYRLKYCLKGLFNPKQAINRPTWCAEQQRLSSYCAGFGQAQRL